MNSQPPSNQVYLEIQVDAANPELLEGLAIWLRLGLIDEGQVKQISQQYLSCPLPVAVTVSPPLASLAIADDFATEKSEILVSSRRTNPIQTLVTQVLASFQEELSLRWLLFLGLFLVIVSSGVLAATQWQKFPPVGQYFILWLYTLTFWGIGFWSKRQENLSLTSQTLQTIALFLIPINFWAMDTFGLGMGLLAIASLSLLGIFFFSQQTNLNLIGHINYLGLNFLHWGWQGIVFPIPAIYLGTIFTASNLTFFFPHRRPDGTVSEKASFSKMLLIYGLLILLVRGIFFLRLPLDSLGLAVGISGWLLRDETGEETTSLDRILDTVGLILLGFGWWVAVTNNATWQALVISGLGLHYFGQRLLRNWKLRDLLALFLIGFLSLFQIRDIIPVGLTETVSNAWMQLSQTANYFPSIYSITFFPYILLWVAVTGWLYRQEKQKLARLGEWLSLGLGICLTSLSLETMVGRSLNLLLSTGTLVYLVSSRSLRVPLIYLTHLVGLLTVISWIDWRFPSFSLTQWGYTLVLLTVGEWLNSIRYQHSSRPSKRQWWYLSSWHFGFILAISSFLIFWLSLNTYFATAIPQQSVLAWLGVPTCLTMIAVVTQKKRSRQAALFSSYGFIFAQFLTFFQPGIRLISLGISAGFVLINSIYCQHLLTARLTIELIFALGLAWLWEIWASPTNISQVFFFPQWVLFDGFYLVLLWLLRDVLKRKNSKIAIIYALACDQIASVLCVFELIRLSFHAGGVAIGELNSGWEWLVSPILILAILVFRFWQEPKDFAVYGLLLAIEILIIESVFGLAGTGLVVSGVNLILAFASLGLTQWLFSRFPNYSHLKSLQISPLLLAFMVIVWRLSYFTVYTAWLTLGAAIVSLFVSSRFPQNKVLLYFSLIGISLACNERIFYQFGKIEDIFLGNQLILLSLLQVGIAFIYRLILGQRRVEGVRSIGHISWQTLEIIADGHWAIAVFLKIIGFMTIVFSSSALNPNPFYLLLSLSVSIYGLLKSHDSRNPNRWIYLGFADLYLTMLFAHWIWRTLELLDPYWGLIATGAALIIYHLPWQSWGWILKPWRNISYSLPLITAFLSFGEISDFSLFAVAVFYAYIAFVQTKIRWSYLTIGILNWIAFRFFERYNLTDVLYFASTIGSSILYLAQVEPKFQDSQNRKIRHYCRVLGSGVINLAALVFHQETGLTPSVISLGTILVSLGLKIRAFLFVGTITFILTVFYQLVILSVRYTLLKWLIGLVVGILLITIAANFERKRGQIQNLLRHWLQYLNEWK